MLARELGERRGRLVEERRPRALVDWAQRPPMNGHSDSRSKQLEGFGCSPGVEVARTQARTPAPDGDQRKIQIRDETRHRVKEVGVPGEVDALGTENRVTERSARPTRRPAAV